MKRSSVLLLVLLLALAGITLYLQFSDRDSTTSGDPSRAFSWQDTAAIDRIFIADKDGSSSELIRTPKGWIVNDKYRARTEAVLNLLEVIKHVEVKMSVPVQARETVIRIMAGRALKVEVYAGGDKVRQYFVGHETADGDGSYMLLSNPETGENYKDPYICFIPGFNGYLQPRYIAKEHEWRDRLLINYIPPEMKKVEMTYYRTVPDSSFTIELQSTTNFRVTDGTGKELDFNEGQVKQYLAYMQNLSYEGLITGKNPRLQDSLANAGPFCELTVTAIPFRTDVYSFFRKRYRGDKNPEIGVQFEYDPDRFYMRFSNGKEWAICQYFVLGKLIQTSDYFQSQ